MDGYCVCKKREAERKTGGLSFRMATGGKSSVDRKVMPECLHGIAEDVTADSLYDVLHELRTVGFDAFPFLCGSDSFIGDGFAAILVFSDTGFHVGEQSA